MQNEVEIAANWWADQLRQPPGRQDAGMNNPDVVMLSAAITLQKNASYTPVPAEKIEDFRKALIDEITKRIGTNWDPANPYKGGALDGRIVFCDYGVSVENALGAALRAAGIVNSKGWIEDSRLPTKTVMRIDPGLVEVKKGYGAPFIEIYKEETDGT